MSPSPPVRDPSIDAFARALRRARRDRDLSQETLAIEAGLWPKHVSEIERANKDPRLSTVFKLADALGIRASELLALAEREREVDAHRPRR